MASFSQRKGIKPLQKAIQREAIDDELRNRLWSVLKLAVWDNWRPRSSYRRQSENARRVEDLVVSIWLHHFKKPVDTIPAFNPKLQQSAYQILRDHFFSAEWSEVYDFIEFILKSSADWSGSLGKHVNRFLEDENAAYRVVQNEIVEITDQNEIEAIESAIDKGVSSSRAHFRRALELLSDRRQPDYRISIEQSISAVEATCQTLAGNNKATLGDCLKLLKFKSPLHPAFEQALHKLYGYTNDDGGIRHSLTEESEHPAYSDAKFMLVACSAFTNYLWTRAAESGLEAKPS